MGPKDLITSSQSSLELKPKRSLGQNFFTNPNLALRIAEIVTSESPELVIEVGPGTGVFTKIFQEKHKVIAIEKDDQLAEMLQNRFIDTVEIINMDVLDVKIGVIDDMVNKHTIDGKAVVFGSLPYNVSKRIIEYLIQIRSCDNFYYIIQKEVAEKYISPKNSVLKARTDIFCNSRIVMNINPGNFNPKPKVTSSLINFSKTETPLLNKENYEEFKKFLSLAFRSPRKTLYNNLKGSSYQIPIDHPLAKERAEDLPTETLCQIFTRV